MLRPFSLVIGQYQGQCQMGQLHLLLLFLYWCNSNAANDNLYAALKWNIFLMKTKNVYEALSIL